MQKVLVRIWTTQNHQVNLSLYHNDGVHIANQLGRDQSATSEKYYLDRLFTFEIQFLRYLHSPQIEENLPGFVL